MPPKIFTSRYSNPELAGDKYTVVGVTRTPPKFPLRYQLQGNIAEIAPPGWLFSETNVERFRTPYFRYLNKTGPFKIKRILGELPVLRQRHCSVLLRGRSRSR